MVTGTEMKRNNKTGAQIISECRGLTRRQVVDNNREKKDRVQCNDISSQRVRFLKEKEQEMFGKMDERKTANTQFLTCGVKTNRSTPKVATEKADTVAGQAGQEGKGGKP